MNMQIFYWIHFFNVREREPSADEYESSVHATFKCINGNNNNAVGHLLTLTTSILF